MIAMGLLGLLTACLFAIFRIGSSAWHKGNTDTELVQQLDLVHHRLAQEVKYSLYAGVSLDPPGAATALSLPSCKIGNLPDYDATLRSPRWHKYVIVYHNPANQEVLLVEKDITPPSTSVIPLAGLAGERNGGHRLARFISRCEFRCQSGLLEVMLEAQKSRYGKQANEIMVVPSSYSFRN
jgi:hypothetical protein